jgi:hypothetical protein
MAEDDIRYPLLNTLLQIKRSDTDLERARMQESDRPMYWLWVFLGRSCWAMKAYQAPGLGAIITTIITYAGLIGLTGFFGLSFANLIENDQLTSHAANIVAYVLLALFILFIVNQAWKVMGEMLNLSSEKFHLGAYKLFRKTEYSIFHPYLKDVAFTFEAVCEYIKQLELRVDSSVLDHMVQNNQKLQTEVDDKKNLLQEAESDAKELNEIIDELLQKVEANEEGYNLTIDLLIRSRPGRNLFNEDDLRLVSAYSLFRLDDNKLIMIYEQGTTETPDMIDLDDPYYQHYSSVMAIKNGKTLEEANADREGRSVISYVIQLDSHEVYIYNFHFSSHNKRFYDIIHTKEMFRMVRAVLYHLKDRGLLEKGGERRVAGE